MNLHVMHFQGANSDANATMSVIGSLPVTPEISALETAYKAFIAVTKLNLSIF